MPVKAGKFLTKGRQVPFPTQDSPQHGAQFGNDSMDKNFRGLLIWSATFANPGKFTNLFISELGNISRVWKRHNPPEDGLCHLSLVT